MYADYDEENIGELSEEEAGAGGRDIAEFEDVLDDYILSRENIDYDPDNKPATGIKDCPAVRCVCCDGLADRKLQKTAEGNRGELSAPEMRGVLLWRAGAGSLVPSPLPRHVK